LVSQPPTPWAEPQPVMDDNLLSPYPVPPDPKDCGEHCRAARAIALNVIVATGSDTRGVCNTPKCTLARRSQLALARRPEYQTSEYLRRFQRSHWRHCAWHPPARQLEATRPVCGQLASRPWTSHPRASGQWLHPLDRLQHQPLDLRLAKLGREPSMPHPGALT